MLIVTLLVGMFAQIGEEVQRQADFASLNEKYEAALAAHYAKEVPEDLTIADRIRLSQAWPGWEYLPQFVALANANPEDATALECCHWIFDRCGNVGNSSKEIFAADQAAWELIIKHQTRSEELPLLCLRAVQYPTPIREKFLRSLPDDYTQPVEVHGYAFLALAELLAHKYEMASNGGPASWPAPRDELEKHARAQIAPEWTKYMTVANPELLRTESCNLFRHVLAHYSDIRVAITAPYFRDIKTLGQKAEKSLHALEHLHVGHEAPPIVGTDLQGKLLKLSDYEGKVVLLSFWFTGCGPCMELIPKEQKLIEKYQNESFAILGVCGDQEPSLGARTTVEQKMTWPCLFDGDTRRIHGDYNILHWPTFYLVDQNGKIAAKDLDPDRIESEVAKLIERRNGG